MRAAALAVAIVFLAGNSVCAQPLLLEIWIDGRNTHVVARVIEQDGAFEVSNADLAAAGVTVAKNGGQIFNAKSSIQAREDVAQQRLLLTIPPARLSSTLADLRPSIVEDVTPASRGAMLSYDISATVSDMSRLRDTSSAGGTLAFTLFHDNARLTLTGFATAGVGAHAARLDTALEFDAPSAPRRIILGDAITGGPQWARSVRFGGVQIATDFSQQPGRVTFPLPQFFGLATVPSTVDVFVGASRVFSGKVGEGPFALENLPVVTGGGSATVVVRDVLGRQTRQTISLFTSPTLLTEGLSSYSLDAGFLRRAYGLSSADYATPFVSALWRNGFRDVTAEVHGAFAKNLALIGAGVASTLGDFGLFAIEGAASGHDGHKGAMAAINVAARRGRFSFFGDVTATTGHFSDLASLTGEAFPRLRYGSGFSAGFGDAGSLSVSWVGQKARGAAANNLVTASYSLSFGNGLFLGLTGFRDFTNRSWAAQAFMSVPLGGAVASASASTGSGATSFQGIYDKPADPDGGFGYRFVAGTAPSQRAEADTRWIADRGELDASTAISNGHTALRIGASGGVVFLGDRLFATRKPDGAVALVETGAPDIRVTRENRVVARSDAEGGALLVGLNPYAANRIGVDPRDYPMDTDVAISSRIVVPPRGAGVVVNLAPVVQHGFVATIRLADGRFPPVGSPVDIGKASPNLIVGRDGEVFLGVPHTVDAEIDLPKGRCRVRIIRPKKAQAFAMRAGPFVCHGEGSHAH